MQNGLSVNHAASGITQQNWATEQLNEMIFIYIKSWYSLLK